MPEVEVFDKHGQFLGRINDETQTVEISEAWRLKCADEAKKKQKPPKTNPSYPPKGTPSYPPKGSPKPK